MGIYVNNGYSPTSSNQQNVSVEHDIIMRGRRIIDITGVKQVESFDSEEFLLETVMGFNDSWSKFTNEKFRCGKGIVSIKGKLMRCCILMKIKGKTKGFFSKLFK